MPPARHMTFDDPTDFGYTRYWHTTFSPFPMKPNIYTYPENADPRALLQHKIAVEQAALDGKPLEVADNDGVFWVPFLSGPLSEVPGFFWDKRRYRVARPKVAAGHNPDKLTDEQVGVAEGWRLLTAEEINGPKGPGVEYLFFPGNWQEAGTTGPHRLHNTYRTKAAVGQYSTPKPKPRYFRGSNGLFGCVSGEDLRYCVEIVAPDTTTFAYLNGTREPAGPLNKVNIATAEAYVAGGWWKEFDGDMTPWKLTYKQLVPWTLETFRWPDCVRRRSCGTKVFGVQLATDEGLYIGIHGADCESDHHEPIEWAELSEDFEYSVDHGKTWLPCGTEAP